MSAQKLLSALFSIALVFVLNVSYSQDRTITGKVMDSKDGSPVSGASVSVKGTRSGTSTKADGTFSINVGASATTLVISSVGFETQEISIEGKSNIDVSFVPSAGANLNEVVVVGYGTARKRDLTGSVASVKAKDFIQGALATPDQLIQGKVAGVQVTNNSGAPGGEVTVRIRGNNSIRSGNQPLYVVDGVPLDGRSARPGLGGLNGGLNDLPGANPLQFINSADIASIDILKDASAAAIYGSRGANGVILITTKRGQSGAPKVDLTVQAGFSNVAKKLEVLNAGTYRTALTKYGVSNANDWGGNVDAFDAITRTGFYQNHTVAISSGNENARYRASFGLFDQKGIVRKSGLKRLSASISGQLKFLESKKLGLDFNIIATRSDEDVAPISNNSGFEGSLIGQALQWNPTRNLVNADGSLNVTGPNFPQNNYNPLALQTYYDDNVKTSTILGSISPYFKFTKELEYRILISANLSKGERRQQISKLMNLENIAGRGFASLGNAQLLTQQITHTLNYNKQINNNINLGATLGYEYMKFENEGSSIRAFDFSGANVPYTNYLQFSTVANRSVSSFADPVTELQSFFGRVNLNWQDRVLLTATLRADGSSKFGENNKYGYFPSFGAAWNLSNEAFLKDNSFVNNLKLRLGWGQTGNQEFPAGAAQERYRSEGQSSFRLVNVANPDLKWETTTTANIGLDFSLLKNKIIGTVEYFNKKTTDLLFQQDVIAPGPSSQYWVNLPGDVLNSGVEFALAYNLISKRDLQATIGGNVTFLTNKLKNYSLPPIETGEINGQGLTGARAQRFANDQPLSVFYLGRFLGIDKNNGQALYDGDPNLNRFYFGSANPKTIMGITGNVTYKKLSFSFNMNGNFGHYIYNNTLQAALAVGNIRNNRNIAQSVFDAPIKEDPANAQPVSNRYLEKGNFLRLSNATLSYGLGNVGKVFKNLTLSVTGANLFIITKYSGFDPEVNTPKTVNGIPSFGIEYTPYPTARSVIFGLTTSF
jgi:TonB-dependent starch-binding outer membrane protein SusC